MRIISLSSDDDQDYSDYGYTSEPPSDAHPASAAHSNSRQTPALSQITALKPALKNQNRVNVFVDDQFSFSLDLAQVVDFKLKVGQQLSPSELQKLQEASNFGKLYQQTLEWVLARPRSVQETQDYLKRKLATRKLKNRQALKNREAPKEDREKYHLKTSEAPLFSDEEIARVISRLLSKNYLNDQKFSEYYLENRFTSKGISAKRLRLELKQKGISEEIITSALESSSRDEIAEIQKIIAKKRKKYNDEQLIQ